MALVKFKYAGDKNGGDVWINPAAVIGIRPGPNAVPSGDPTTILYTGPGMSFTVEGIPARVAATVDAGLKG